jgi:hypothetical protein
MPTLSKKNSNPFAPDQVVRAKRTFAHQNGVVHIGEEYRGDDPVVKANWTAFVDGATLDQELENVFDELPEPPTHAPAITVQSIQIPAHRQVRSLVDVAAAMKWAPDSPGAKSGAPPPFARTQLRQGQLVDALHPIVRQHPEWFSWPARQVLLEDIERLERHEREEVR